MRFVGQCDSVVFFGPQLSGPLRAEALALGTLRLRAAALMSPFTVLNEISYKTLSAKTKLCGPCPLILRLPFPLLPAQPDQVAHKLWNITTPPGFGSLPDGLTALPQ